MSSSAEDMGLIELDWVRRCTKGASNQDKTYGRRRVGGVDQTGELRESIHFDF